MAQYLRPNAYGGNQAGTWYGGSGQVDEVTRDDTDFLNSSNNAAGDYTTVRLSSPASTPDIGDMLFRYTYTSSNTGSTPMAPASGGTQPNIQFSIEENVGGTWTNRYTGTLLGCPTNGSWGSNTGTIPFSTWGLWDLSLLRVKIDFVSGGGGSPSNRRGVACSWIEVEVPDPPSASFTLAVDPATLTFGTGADIPLRRSFRLRVDSTLAQFKAAPDDSFKLNSAIAVDAQAAAFTGNDVQLILAVSYTLAVDSSALTFAPSTVGFTEAAYLPVQSTSVAFSPQSVTLSFTDNKSLAVDSTQASFSGQDVQLLATARIPVDTATVSFYPQNITSNNSLVITSNTLLFSPQNVTLSLSTGQSFTLAVNEASLILSTQQLGMLLSVSGGGTIDGLPSAVINTDNDSLTLYGRAGNYYSIDYGITKLQ